MSKKLRFAYVSAIDPKNKKLWSGTHYSIYSNLSKHFGEVEILGPYEPSFKVFLGKIKNVLSQKLFGKRFDYQHSHWISKSYGAYFSEKLKDKQFDFIIAPAASIEIAHLKTNIPIIYVSDTTYKRSIGYHKALSYLSKQSEKEGVELEGLCINNSSIVVMSSQWAIDSAINDFHCKTNKLLLSPFGANFENLPNENELELELPKTWKLLFMGVYWESKGGAFAFNCFKELSDKGYNVELTICGCIPPEEFKHSKMTVIPFIDKNNEEGRKKLYSVFQQSHFLVLPTRFDCTPIVFCEASAFGVPSISSNTGGVSGHLTEGENGFLIDYNDTGKGYAAKIEEYILAPAKYLSLRKSTKVKYHKELNWNHWIASLENKIETLFPEKANNTFGK
jgi:glycosyltransferase involved in cell wall biosynthesis